MSDYAIEGSDYERLQRENAALKAALRDIAKDSVDAERCVWCGGYPDGQRQASIQLFGRQPKHHTYCPTMKARQALEAQDAEKGGE